MYSSTSFNIQIANLCLEICGYNDEDSACLQDLKRIFKHHEVDRDTTALHRILVCSSKQFEITPEATLRWVAPCLGVAGLLPFRRWRLIANIFSPNKERPKYSGTCDVRCYKDSLRQVDYFIPENSQWRIKHVANDHVTYVFFDGLIDMSDGLPSMLINAIGSQYGCYLLFASCVAVDGQALLFTGDSGIGKTTLCMELMKQGATYIGDDLVLVYQNEEQAMVGSLLFPVKYYANNIYSHKKKSDIVSQLSQRPPLNVPLHSVYNIQRAESTNIESYLKPMPKDKMFEILLKYTNKANTNADGHHFVDTLSYICCAIPCYYLFYGKYDDITTSFFADHDQI